MTQRELADRLNDEIRNTTGSPGKLTDRYVRLLLDGSIRWPWPTRRQALEAVLGLPILELGFVPRAARGYREERPPAAIREPASQPLPTPAVELLAVADGRPVVLEVPPLPVGKMGVSDLDQLAGPLTQLYDLHVQYGPGRLAAAAARQAIRLRAAHDCVMSSRVRAGLYGLSGEWWTTAAWFAIETGEPAVAGRYLRRALWQAAAARDPMLDAHVAHVMASRAAHLGSHVAAAALANSMLHWSRGAAVSRRVSAVGHLHAAAAHAMQGGLPRAELSLDLAHDAFQAAAGEPAPPWLARLGTWTVDACRARAAVAVGRYDLAAKHGRQAVETTPDGQVWDRLMALLLLVDGCLGLREVEEAAGHASAALDLALQLTDPFGCVPVAAELERIARGLAAWPEVSSAQVWNARYRDTAAARAAKAAYRPTTPRRGGDRSWPRGCGPAPQQPADLAPQEISMTGAG